MKSELEYLKLALAEYVKREGKWSAMAPLSGVQVLAVLTIADELRAADKKALETT